MRPTWRSWRWWLAALFYALLAAVLTWPAARQFSTHVAGFPGRDSLQYTWSLWWSRQAWLAGVSPAQTSMLYRPWQAVNPLLAVAPTLDALAFLLQPLLTPTQVYNALLLASLALSGLAMYALAFDRTGHQGGALLAGAVYALGAPRLGHALSGHLSHVAAWWLPLAALFGLRALEQLKWRDAVLCGLCAGLGLLVAPVQAAYLVAPGLAILLALEAWRQRRTLSRRHLWLALVAIAVAAALVAPFYGPFLAQTLGDGLDLSAAGVQDYAVDPALLLLPSPYHPLWGGLVRRLSFVAAAMPEPNDLEQVAYLGVLPLALALLGWWRARRERWPWLTLLVTALVLALGPQLRFAGHATKVPLPYALLQRLPLFGWGRTPERFLQLAAFAVALLAAQALADRRLRWPGVAGILVATILGAVAFWPWPSGTPLPPPELSSWRGQGGVVLDLPISKRQVGNLAMYEQTTHGLPIIGGYIHRDPPGQRAYVKALDQAIMAQQEGAERALAPAELRALLQGLDVRHVLLHGEYLRADQLADARGRLAAALGSPGVAWGEVIAFDVPAALANVSWVAQFDDALSLQVLAITEVGDGLTVDLLWHASGTPERDLTVFVHALDAQANRVGQHDGRLAGGNLSLADLAPGQTVLDQHFLAVAGEPNDGWRLAVGLYDSATGQRAAVRAGSLPIEDGAVIVPWPTR